MFARRTKTGIKPMLENEFETIASDIGSQTIVVRRVFDRILMHVMLKLDACIFQVFCLQFMQSQQFIFYCKGKLEK